MPHYYNQKNLGMEKTLKRVRESMYASGSDLKAVAYRTKEPVAFERRKSGRKLEMKPGKKWGNLFDCAWFHFTGKAPKAVSGKKTVLLLDVSGEMCVVDRNGDPLLGMTAVTGWQENGPLEFSKQVLALDGRICNGGKIDFWADAGCNNLFGRIYRNGTFKCAQTAVCNVELRGLYYDLEVLFELMKALPEDSARHQQIMHSLHQATLQLVNYNEEEALKARGILAGELKKKGGDASLTISAVGHAHLDLAWLWPIRETIRKGARTFATAVDLIERYPDYIFGASQGQLFQWIKDQYPALYEKIKRQVASGRWELQGGMWVEADTNVPSGESLVRQFLYGRRFFQKEFGVSVVTHWLPDVFGFSGAMPQIMKKCQVKYFLTQKLSWNDTNVFPHNTFIWKGIDKTAVLTHFCPLGDYNSKATPGDVMQAEKNYRDKSVSDRLLLLYGIGDGGGGPGAEHLERLQRVKNLSGIAPVVSESAESFFRKLDKRRAGYCCWEGELYLEKHRGAYTSQARNKRYNRKMELALRELEFISSLGCLTSGRSYPAAEIERLWKEVLLYQFHDIIPGSSIKRVYDESLKRYKVMLQETERLQVAADAWFKQIDAVNMKRPVAVSNSLDFQRRQWIKIASKWFDVTVPAMGYATVDVAEVKKCPELVSVADNELGNDLLRVAFNEDGSIRSIYDKLQKRQVLKSGQAGNRLAVYVDQPREWEAWDVDIDYIEREPEYFRLVATQTRIDGPRAIMRQEYVYGDSRLQQEVILTLGSGRLDFITEVNWRESEKMLRTSFPVAVSACEATCEIQFGNLKRPLHANTSWDSARYEICAHKWVDISQGDYGTALLNDCKYGYRVRDGVLDLNLLRSSIMPDPVADRARHSFTYSLYPHQGDYIRGLVVQEAYALNVPLRTFGIVAGQKGKLPPSASMLHSDCDNVMIETVKKAEDSDDLIVRLYETHGCDVKARLHFNFDVDSVQLADMMEENPRKLTMRNNSVKLAFRPFEIHTIKLNCLVGKTFSLME